MKSVSAPFMRRQDQREAKIRTVRQQFALVICGLLLTQFAVAQLQRSDIFYPKHGLVLGKTVALDPESQQPILVVVNELGEEVEELGPRIPPLDEMKIWNAQIYRAEAQAYSALRENLPASVIQGHCIVSIDNYGSEHCGNPTVTVPPTTPDGESEEVTIEYPERLSDIPSFGVRDIPNVKYVVLRNSSTIADPRLLGPDGPVLMVSRINLNEIDQSLLENLELRSLLLTDEGSVHYSTQHNITYRSGYFRATDDYDENRASGILAQDRERALGPIAGAKVFSGYDVTERFAQRTDQDGAFRVEYYLPPCPCTTFFYDGDLWAEIPYKNYNPLNAEELPFASFFASTPTSDVCSGYHYCPLVPGGLRSNIAAIHATTAIPAGYFRRDIKFDAMIITGEGELTDERDAPIPVSTNTAFATQQQGSFADQNPNSLNFDFDLDRQVDQAVLYNNEYYVYLGGRDPEYNEQNAPINEDLRRQPDQLNDYRDRGLLESISLEDLKETDLYIYRVSTGELIVERENLKPQEYARLSSGGVGDDATTGSFFYRQLMRGPRVLEGAFGNRLSQWWSDADIKIDLFNNFQADFLRMGEEVQIIAINRPTGYIGSTIATLQFNNESGTNTLDVPIDKLRLRAPNLKVRAERGTAIELGLSASDNIQEYLIGSEGAGLTSDTYIAIKTEWFDHDGRPLPSDLPGYSGTLAKIVGDQQLNTDSACTSNASPISIKPGSRIQLLKLGDNCDLGTEHYYVYVCGHNRADAAQDKCFNFNNTNAIGRPQYYVPVKVPFYDEVASRQRYNAYRFGKQDGIIAEDADAPEDIYRWHYRPEMQFSVFDLQVQQFNAVRERENNQQDIIDLLSQDTPVFGSDTDYAQLLFNLLVNEGAPLDSFGPDRDLVFALGEEEVLATFGEDQTLQFSNVDHLGSLQPEDFLTLRLYANNDAANILWEFAFDTLNLVVAEDTPYDDGSSDTGLILVSADNPTLAIDAELLSITNNPGEEKTVRFIVDGDASATPEVVRSTTGIFRTHLNFSRQAGSLVSVKAQLLGTAAESKTLGKIMVIPGEPALISTSFDGSRSHTYARGVQPLVAAVNVRDAFGNQVIGGTPINFNVSGSASIVEENDTVTGGYARVTIEGGDYPNAVNEFTAVVGDIQTSASFSVLPLDISLESLPQDVQLGTIVDLNISATAGGVPVENVPLDIAVTHGRLLASDVPVTDAQGRLSLRWYTGTAIGNATLRACAQSDQCTNETDIVIGVPGGDSERPIPAQLALVGDQAGTGTISTQRYDGSVVVANYATDGELSISGAPSTQVDVSLGSLSHPNHPRLLNIAMADAVLGRRAYSGIQYENNGAYTVSDHPIGIGRSAHFDGSGEFTLTSENVDIDINDFGLTIKFKPIENGGVILQQQDGLSLALTSSGELNLQLNTSDAVFTVTEPNITLNQWYSVSARLNAGVLTFHLDGRPQQTMAIPNAIDYTAGPLTNTAPNTLEFGNGFVGRVASISYYDSSSAPLVTFDDGTTQTTLMLDATGIGRVDVTAQATDLNRTRAAEIPLRVNTEPQVSMIVTSLAERIKMESLQATVANAPVAPENLAPLLQESIAYDDAQFIAERIVGAALDTQRVSRIDALAGIVASLEYLPDGASLIPHLLKIQQFFASSNNPRARESALASIGIPVKQALAGGEDTLKRVHLALLVLSELIDVSPEAAGWVTQSISSRHDFDTWMKLFSLPAQGWLGFEPPVPAIGSRCSDNVPRMDVGAGVSLPLIPCRLTGALMAETILGIVRGNEAILATNPERLPRSLAVIVDNLPYADLLVRRYLFEGSSDTVAVNGLEPFIPTAHAAVPVAIAAILRIAANVGVKLTKGSIKNVVAFFIGRTNSRVHPLMVLSILGYLESRLNANPATCNCVPISNAEVVNRIRSLQKQILVNIAVKGGFTSSRNGQFTCKLWSNSHGLLFELLMAAYFHARFEFLEGNDEYQITGMGRRETIVIYDQNGGFYTDYGRDTDIILRGDTDDPIWVELKSYQSRRNLRSHIAGTPGNLRSRWPLWDAPKRKINNSRTTSNHRQILLDTIASSDATFSNGSTRSRVASDYFWLLQDWKKRDKLPYRFDRDPGISMVDHSAFGGFSNDMLWARDRMSDLGKTTEGKKIIAANIGRQDFTYRLPLGVPGPLNRRRFDGFNWTTEIKAEIYGEIVERLPQDVQQAIAILEETQEKLDSVEEQLHKSEQWIRDRLPEITIPEWLKDARDQLRELEEKLQEWEDEIENKVTDLLPDEILETSCL